MTLSYQCVLVACWRHETERLRKVVENLDLHKLAAISCDRIAFRKPNETEN